MDLDAVADGIAERLDTIAGLRVHSEVPQKINPPAAIIGLGSGTFETFEGLGSADFGVLLLLSAASSERSQKELRSYLTGDKSIADAVNTPSLELAGNPVGVSLQCLGWNTPDVVNLGGIDYVGVQVNLTAAE